MKFSVIGPVEHLGVAATRLVCDLRDGTHFEAIVTGSPEFIVLEQTIIGKDGKMLRKQEVTRLERFEGTLYPAAGRLQETAIGKLKGKDYRFDMQRVQRRKDSSWFPEWPVGTRVIDHTNGSVQTVIPYPPEVIAKLRPSNQPRAVTSNRKWLMWALNLSAAVGLGVLIWWRLRSRRGVR